MRDSERARYLRRRAEVAAGGGGPCGSATKYRLGCKCEACRRAGQLDYIANRDAILARSKARRRPADRPCTKCGAMFIDETTTNNRRLCSACVRDRQERWERRRRARKRDAVSEPYTLREIAERDNWRCHICAARVLDKPWPHPRSASIDHLVPLSAGGDDTKANVGLACLRCNLRKGAKPAGEQLRLLG